MSGLASVKLSEAYLRLFLPSHSFVCSLEERKNVTTVFPVVSIWNKRKGLAVTESNLRRESHLWLEEPFAEGMSVNTHCLGSNVQLGLQSAS